MKMLLMCFGILLYSPILSALVEVSNNGVLTQSFNGSSSIQIDGRDYLVNDDTIITSASNVPIRSIPVNTRVNFSIVDEDAVPPTIDSIWMSE
jgi:hypothetical protein